MSYTDVLAAIARRLAIALLALAAPGALSAQTGFTDAQWQVIAEPSFDGDNRTLVADDVGGLYVGGDSRLLPGGMRASVAYWDGDRWSSLGAGVAGGVDLLVRDPATGDIYAAGTFAEAGGAPALNIARWDGEAWSALAEGIPARILAMAWDPLGGRLFVAHEGTEGAGRPQSIVSAWAGGQWTAAPPLQPGDPSVAPRILALAVDAATGELYAGGYFRVTEGSTDASVARLDATGWHALGGGLRRESSPRPARIHALAWDARVASLIVAGDFNLIGEQYSPQVARYREGAWERLPAFARFNMLQFLLSSPTGQMLAGDDRGVLSVFDEDGFEILPATLRSNGLPHWAPDGRLYLLRPSTIEGRGERQIPLIAVWDGGTFSDLGPRTQGNLGSIAFDAAGAVYAGGIDIIDGRSFNGIARWTEAAGWEDVGGGVSFAPDSWHGQNGYRGEVLVLLADRVSGGVFAGGWFGRAGGVAAGNIALWDGEAWRSLGGGVPAMQVSAIAQHPIDGSVYVAGWDLAASTIVSRVDRWDGQAWTRLPGEFEGTEITSLAFSDDGRELMAGGGFWRIDGLLSGPLARWNGEWWEFIQPRWSGRPVVSVAWDHAERRWLIGRAAQPIAGVETLGPSGTTSLLGGEAGPASPQGLLVLPQGDIVALGIGVHRDYPSAPGAKRWDGQAWSPLGSGIGVGGTVEAAAASADGTRVAVIGRLRTAGGKPAVVAIARLDGAVNQPPHFAATPVLVGRPDVGETLSVQAAADDADGDPVRLTYQWRREGVPIPGATGRDHRVRLEDAGRRLSADVRASDGKDANAMRTESVRVSSEGANVPPRFTGSPVITGQASAGAVLGLAGLDTTDADGDAVSVSALWMVDGIPLPGETGMTLVVPAGLRGRSISAEVSASDGVAAVSRDTPGVRVGNAAPIARTDTLLAVLTPMVTFPAFVLRNDADPDGDAMVASLASGPASGTARIEADGSLLLTGLPTDAPYSDRLTYRVCDPSGACATAVVHLEFERPLLEPAEFFLGLPSDHSVHELLVGVQDDSARAVAGIVDLRLAPSRGYGWFVQGEPGVTEVRLPPNPADAPASYAVHVEAFAGPGGDASLLVRASGVADPALACSGDAGLRSTCSVQVVVPARSPGITLRYAADTLSPNSDPDIEVVLRHVVEPLDATGVHGRVVAVVGKRVERFTAPVRVVVDVAGAQPGQTMLLAAVEVRDGAGGTLLGRRTMQFVRQNESPAPRALVPGRPTFLAVLPYQAYGYDALHERARLEVPAGATSALVEIDAPAGVTGALVAPAVEAGDPRAQAVPLRPDAASTRVPLARGDDGQLVALVEGDALVPGIWTLELAYDTFSSAEVVVRVDTTLALGSGAVPLRPGHYFNPGRDGHGVFLERGGTQMVAWWYTYRQDGSPTWYMAQADAPADGLPFAGDAYRVTWSLDGGATLYDVGQVAITPAADGSLGFAYEVDGATGHERLVSLSEGGCLPVDGVSVDGAGSWFSPERSGFGYSVMWDERTSQEIMVTYAYDAEGQPRWGYAQAPASAEAVASLPIVQLQGFAPDAAWRPLVNLGRIGTLRRTIGVMPQDGQPGLRRASVAMAFTGPVTGAFVQDLETALLTNRRACR